MEIEKMKVLGAGNAHARRPVLEMRLASGSRRKLAPEEVRGLFAALPPLCADVTDFSALRRLSAAAGPVPAAAVLEVLAILAQRYMNWPVRFCSWRENNQSDGSRAIYEIGTRRVGLRAGKIALELLEGFLHEGGTTDLHALFRANMVALVRRTSNETPSSDAMAIARVAADQGIPWTTLPGSSYVRLGWGRHASVVRGSESTRTPSVAYSIAQRKTVTNALLAEVGLPVPRHKPVRRPEGAVAAARDLGFPVVVKPASGNMGKGVSVGVTDEAGVLAAFARAQAVSRTVVVETFIQGDEYRLLVIGGRFVAAARRRPAQVRGDGESTVRELVARENARPEREGILPGRMAARVPLLFDAEAIELLAAQGHTETTIPAADEVVLLRRESNVSRGGDSVDETDRVHPTIRQVAERAAAVLQIDVCGVDFISPDITRPWSETRSAICEVNTRPGLSLHAVVSEGTARSPAVDVVRMLYPEGAPHRIPVVAILDCAEGAPLRAAIETAAARAGRRLGLVVRPGGRNATRAETRRLDRASALPWDDSIDGAVLEVSAEEVARRGLGVERIDLAILSPEGASPSTARAGAALARLSGNRVVASNDSRALAKALKVLGLPAGRRQSPAVAPVATEASRTAITSGLSDRFTVLMVGDTGFGEPYFQHRRASDLQRLLDPDGYGHSLASMRPLLDSADMVVANLEVPLSAWTDPGLRGRKKYLGWADADKTISAIRGAGIRAVSLANNHSLDCGLPGLIETIGRLNEAGIATFGAGSDLESADRPYIATFKVGDAERSLVVFGGFEHRTRYQKRYRWYAGRGTAGVSELSAERIGAAIELLREKLPSPVFVAYPHWGTDYRGIIDQQRAYAAELVDAGADVIIGHGSHTAQGVEMIGDRPVVYGLGNFVWNTPGRFAMFQAKPYGLAAALEFRGREERADIGLRLYPILTDNTLTAFQNRPVTEAEFAEAAEDLTARSNGRLEHKRDASGQHLEIWFASRSSGRNDPLPSGTAASSDATARLEPGVLAAAG